MNFATKVDVEYVASKFNSFYYYYIEGDFISHFSGNLSSEVREQLISEYIQKIDENI